MMKYAIAYLGRIGRGKAQQRKCRIFRHWPVQANTFHAAFLVRRGATLPDVDQFPAILNTLRNGDMFIRPSCRWA
jgi:hypothetical protein